MLILRSDLISQLTLRTVRLCLYPLPPFKLIHTTVVQLTEVQATLTTKNTLMGILLHNTRR